jgi:transposase
MDVSGADCPSGTATGIASSAHESLGQERRFGPGVCQIAARADSAYQDRSLQFGFDLGESASRRNRGFKKNGPQAIGKSRGGWNTKIHLVAANARTAIMFCLSPGQAHDAPVGRQLLLELGPLPVEVPLVMDRAYESDETRQLVLEMNMIPVVPPKSNRREPWEYDRELYKKRNQIERLFRRLKGFRRIFSRYEKLDVVFLAFIYFAFIIEALR